MPARRVGYKVDVSFTVYFAMMLSISQYKKTSLRRSIFHFMRGDLILYCENDPQVR